MKQALSPVEGEEKHLDFASASKNLQLQAIQNELLQKPLESPRDAAELVDKIVRFFYYENSDYLQNQEVDYKKTFTGSMSHLYTYLSNHWREAIYAMYQEFEKQGGVTHMDILERSESLLVTINKNNYIKFLEILFSPFATLAWYREETSHWHTEKMQFSAYGRLIWNGCLYLENRAVDITRPNADTPSITFLKPRIHNPDEIQSKITTQADILLSWLSIDHPQSTLWSNVFSLFPWLQSTTAEQEMLPKEEDKSDWAKIEPSEAQKWATRRRERSRGVRIGKEESRSVQRNQEWYNGELEKLQAFSAFLHERFEELRLYLLEQVPYVEEVSDYISLIERLKERWYEVSTLDVNEVRQDYERLIADYSRLITWKRWTNMKLKEDIDTLFATLNDRLLNVTDVERKKIIRRINKAQSNIDRNTADISAYESEMTLRQNESSEIFTQVRGYRLTTIPNREQFSLAFHHSLRAEELYSAPDFVPENPVTYEWIDANVIPLFVSILGTHLHEYHGVNVRDLYELMGKIDELPEWYNEGIEIPDMEELSQRKVSDFFAMVTPLIPRDYLSELPSLPTIITPEWISPRVLPKVKVPKVKKTHREMREATSLRKTAINQKRWVILNEIRKKDWALVEYEQYWRERLRQNIRTRMQYFADIEKIDLKVRLRRAYPNKTKEDLQTLIQTSQAEETEIRQKINEWKLINDEVRYRKDMEERARLSQKLQSIR